VQFKAKKSNRSFKDSGGQFNNDFILVDSYCLPEMSKNYFNSYCFFSLIKKCLAMMFRNAISWVEIPATDLSRAQNFYESIFDFKMIPFDMQDIKMRMFPLTDMMEWVARYAAVADFTSLQLDGLLVYLNANPDVQIVLDKTEAAGVLLFFQKQQFHQSMAI
jgi:predicted enzyme related to lactoylglutathione lyase